jgi:DNA-binding NtrC family response regulator
VQQFLAKMGPIGPEAEPPRVDDATMSALQAHDWPGNVRELRNVLERALAIGTDARRLIAPLGDQHLAGASRAAPAGDWSFDPALPFREQKERWSDEFERRYLTWLLARADGNISKAARDADMDRKYLHKLLKKHDIAE